MFEQFSDQSRVGALLSAALVRDEVAHAYLFVGASETELEALANAFSAALLCTASVEQRPCGVCNACKAFERGNAADFIRVYPEEGAQNIKIRQIRDMINVIARRTFDGGVRVCFISQAEKMTTEAQNALLKSLEEPSPGTIFILTAQKGEGLLPTIRSRCQVMTLREGTEDGVQLDSSIEEQVCSVLRDLFDGKSFSFFAFSEVMGKDKKNSEAVIKMLIVAFEAAFRREKIGKNIAFEPSQPQNEKLAMLLKNNLKPGQAEPVLKVLFECLSRMQYNVNLRLQWENLFLKVLEIINR